MVVILCLLCFGGAGEAGRGFPITGAVDGHKQMQRIGNQRLSDEKLWSSPYSLPDDFVSY